MLKGFKELKKKLDSYDKKREELIKKARDLLKISKQTIYSIHRGNSEEAFANKKKAEKIKKELDKIANFDKKLSFEGSYSDACQEYAEAIFYYDYVKDEKIPTPKELKINHEDYLMGLCDLTGELTRRAVRLATKKKSKEVEKIKVFVEEIFGEFLKFNLRNGHLRKKFDSIKWNLKKLEEIMYDVKVK